MDIEKKTYMEIKITAYEAQRLANLLSILTSSKCNEITTKDKADAIDIVNKLECAANS